MPGSCCGRSWLVLEGGVSQGVLLCIHQPTNLLGEARRASFSSFFWGATAARVMKYAFLHVCSRELLLHCMDRSMAAAVSTLLAQGLPLSLGAHLLQVHNTACAAVNEPVMCHISYQDTAAPMGAKKA